MGVNSDFFHSRDSPLAFHRDLHEGSGYSMYDFKRAYRVK